MGNADARGVGVVCRRVIRFGFRSTTALLDGAARGACEERQKSNFHIKAHTVKNLYSNVSMNMIEYDSMSCFTRDDIIQHRFSRAKVLVSSQSSPSGAPGHQASA